MNALNTWIQNDVNFVVALVLGVTLSAAIGVIFPIEMAARKAESRMRGKGNSSGNGNKPLVGNTGGQALLRAIKRDQPNRFNQP